MNKTLKLKKNYEFKNILTKGNYYSGKYLDVFMRRNNKSVNFIGIAVGVKIAKAVKRNRIKRLIRENYRLFEKNLKVGYSIVFLWKKKADIKQATFFNIKEDMLNIFEKMGIIE